MGQKGSWDISWANPLWSERILSKYRGCRTDRALDERKPRHGWPERTYKRGKRHSMKGPYPSPRFKVFWEVTQYLLTVLAVVPSDVSIGITQMQISPSISIFGRLGPSNHPKQVPVLRLLFCRQLRDPGDPQRNPHPVWLSQYLFLTILRAYK